MEPWAWAVVAAAAVFVFIAIYCATRSHPRSAPLTKVGPEEHYRFTAPDDRRTHNDLRAVEAQALELHRLSDLAYAALR